MDAAAATAGVRRTGYTIGAGSPAGSPAAAEAARAAAAEAVTACTATGVPTQGPGNPGREPLSADTADSVIDAVPRSVPCTAAATAGGHSGGIIEHRPFSVAALSRAHHRLVAAASRRIVAATPAAAGTAVAADCTRLAATTTARGDYPGESRFAPALALAIGSRRRGRATRADLDTVRRTRRYPERSGPKPARTTAACPLDVVIAPAAAGTAAADHQILDFGDAFRRGKLVRTGVAKDVDPISAAVAVVDVDNVVCCRGRLHVAEQQGGSEQGSDDEAVGDEFSRHKSDPVQVAQTLQRLGKHDWVWGIIAAAQTARQARVATSSDHIRHIPQHCGRYFLKGFDWSRWFRVGRGHGVAPGTERLQDCRFDRLAGLRFLVLALLLLPATATSATIDLAPLIEMLEDAEGTLTLADVKGEAAARFQRWGASGDVNQSFTGSALWLRLALARGEGSAERLLELAYLVDEATFFAPGQVPVTTGQAYPSNSRSWPHRFFAFPVTLGETPRYYYLRVRTHGSATVPLVLWEHAAFSTHQQRTYSLLALYYGGLLALLIYNFSIYLSLREPAFLHYTLFVGSMGLAQLAANGTGQQFLWPSDWPWIESASAALFALTGACGVLFSQTFLQTRRQLPRLHRYLRFSALFFIMCAALALSGAEALGRQAVPFWGLLVAGLIFATAISSLRRGNLSARYFLAGWGVLWAGVIVAGLREFGLLPSNVITGYAILIASSIEMLLLSLALADRIRRERQARELAQAETLDVRQAMVDSLRASEARLERTVEERTAQLSESLQKEKQLLTRMVRLGAMIAHEFRNPLAVVKSQLALIGEERKHGIDRVSHRIDTAMGAADRLERLFDDWLQSDRMTRRMEALTPAEIDLHAWLPRVVQECRRYLPGRPIELRLPRRLPAIVADDVLLQSALRNLIENAAKYAPMNTPVTVEVLAGKACAGLAVIDEGQAIPAEHRDEIFLEYVRGSNTRNSAGLGLGLALVRRVAELHGGRVELHSAGGNGNRFCLWLPLKPTEEVFDE